MSPFGEFLQKEKLQSGSDEERFAKANETIQWIVSSDERAELRRGAGNPAR